MGEEAEAAREQLASELAGLGLALEGDGPQAAREWHLWPEHLPAFELFLGLQTQWVVGMGGPVGLAYAGVESELRMCGLRRGKRRERFAELKHLERGWLQGWHERNNKANK